MPRLSRLLPSALALALLIVPVVAYLAVDDGRLARMGFTPHVPDWRLLLASPPAIQIHVAAALTALAIGIVLLIGVKETGCTGPWAGPGCWPWRRRRSAPSSSIGSIQAAPEASP